jgi:hypothetical protein
MVNERYLETGRRQSQMNRNFCCGCVDESPFNSFGVTRDVRKLLFIEVEIFGQFVFLSYCFGSKTLYRSVYMDIGYSRLNYTVNEN